MGALPGGRVLIVDDYPDTATSLATLLAHMGYETRAAFDTPSALALAQTFAPQAAIIDLQLPELDGCHLAQQIRALPGLGRTLLIAYTGSNRPDDPQRERDAGFDFHVRKPADPNMLASLLPQADS